MRNTTEVTPSVGERYWVRVFEIERSFNQSQIIKGIGVSKPLVEWDFNVEGAYKLKKYGAIKLVIKTHLGTFNLERANFVIWPYHAEYRAKGHYTLNRSYIGIYTGFVFVRHKYAES